MKDLLWLAALVSLFLASLLRERRAYEKGYVQGLSDGCGDALNAYGEGRRAANE